MEIKYHISYHSRRYLNFIIFSSSFFGMFYFTYIFVIGHMQSTILREARSVYPHCFILSKETPKVLDRNFNLRPYR